MDNGGSHTHERRSETTRPMSNMQTTVADGRLHDVRTSRYAQILEMGASSAWALKSCSSALLRWHWVAAGLLACRGAYFLAPLALQARFFSRWNAAATAGKTRRHAQLMARARVVCTQQSKARALRMLKHAHVVSAESAAHGAGSSSRVKAASEAMLGRHHQACQGIELLRLSRLRHGFAHLRSAHVPALESISLSGVHGSCGISSNLSPPAAVQHADFHQQQETLKAELVRSLRRLQEIRMSRASPRALRL